MRFRRKFVGTRRLSQALAGMLCDRLELPRACVCACWIESCLQASAICHLAPSARTELPVCRPARPGAMDSARRFRVSQKTPRASLGWSVGAAEEKDQPLAKRFRAIQKTPEAYLDLLTEMGPENKHARQHLYLITLSRVIPDRAAGLGLRSLEALSRSQVASFVRDAFNNPVVSAAGGRPRTLEGERVEMVLVCREKHADGSSHFHAVVKLREASRFGVAKLTLRERHRLSSHFSCSHAQLWSAVRYLCVPSPSKPEVDAKPHVWTRDGHPVDLYALSQQPFVAEAWRLRREQRERESLVAEERAPSYNKLDLTALVLSKGFKTKSALLAHVQEHGSAAMQLFVSKQQRRLDECRAPRVVHLSHVCFSARGWVRDGGRGTSRTPTSGTPRTLWLKQSESPTGRWC